MCSVNIIKHRVNKIYSFVLGLQYALDAATVASRPMSRDFSTRHGWPVSFGTLAQPQPV